MEPEAALRTGADPKDESVHPEEAERNEDWPKFKSWDLYGTPLEQVATIFGTARTRAERQRTLKHFMTLPVARHMPRKIQSFITDLGYDIPRIPGSTGDGPSVFKVADPSEDGRWITIKRMGVAAHIFIGPDGTVKKGPSHLIGANISHLPEMPAELQSMHHWEHGEQPAGFDDHPDYTESDAPQAVPEREVGDRVERTFQSMRDNADGAAITSEHFGVRPESVVASRAFGEAMKGPRWADNHKEITVRRKQQACDSIAKGLQDSGITNEEARSVINRVAGFFVHHEAYVEGKDKDYTGAKGTNYAAFSTIGLDPRRDASVRLDPAEDDRHRLARVLLSQWSITAADRNPLSLALQLAAKKRFGLSAWDVKPSHIRNRDPNVPDDEAIAQGERAWNEAQSIAADPGFARVGEAFWSNVYDTTQRALKAAGLREVVLTRGIRGVRDDGVVRNATTAQTAAQVAGHGDRWHAYGTVDELRTANNPISAWTTSGNIGVYFAHMSHHKTNGAVPLNADPAGRGADLVLVGSVPARDIISCGGIGPGTVGQEEFLVMNKNRKVGYVVGGNDARVRNVMNRMLGKGREFEERPAVTPKPKSVPFYGPAETSYSKPINGTALGTMTPLKTVGSTRMDLGADGHMYVTKTQPNATTSRDKNYHLVAEHLGNQLARHLGLRHLASALRTMDGKTELHTRPIDPISNIAHWTTAHFDSMTKDQANEIMLNHAFDQLTGNADTHGENMLLSRDAHLVGIGRHQVGKYVDHPSFDLSKPSYDSEGIADFPKGQSTPRLTGGRLGVVYKGYLTSLKKGTMIHKPDMKKLGQFLNRVEDTFKQGTFDSELTDLARRRYAQVDPESPDVVPPAAFLNTMRRRAFALRGQLIRMYGDLGLDTSPLEKK